MDTYLIIINIQLSEYYYTIVQRNSTHNTIIQGTTSRKTYS